MLTMSLSFNAPPEPVFPWSSVTISMLAAPTESRVGVKASPSSVH